MGRLIVNSIGPARVARNERPPMLQRCSPFEALLLRAGGQPGGYCSPLRSHRRQQPAGNLGPYWTAESPPGPSSRASKQLPDCSRHGGTYPQGRPLILALLGQRHDTVDSAGPTAARHGSFSWRSLTRCSVLEWFCRHVSVAEAAGLARPAISISATTSPPSRAVACMKRNETRCHCAIVGRRRAQCTACEAARRHGPRTALFARLAPPPSPWALCARRRPEVVDSTASSARLAGWKLRHGSAV